MKRLLSAGHFSVDGTMLKASGQESRLAYLGHALMENRNGLAVAAKVTHPTGTGEREAALEMTETLPQGVTLGADKAYDVEALVNDLKARKTAVPDDVATSDGYAISLRCRKRIEEIFGRGRRPAGSAS